MPTWRADYFYNPKDEAPSRSEIIVFEDESDALHEARSKMGLSDWRAEVIHVEVIHTVEKPVSRLNSVDVCFASHPVG